MQQLTQEILDAMPEIDGWKVLTGIWEVKSLVVVTCRVRVRGGEILAGNGGVILAYDGGEILADAGGVIRAGNGGVILAGDGGLILAGNGGLIRVDDGGVIRADDGGLIRAYDGGVIRAGNLCVPLDVVNENMKTVARLALATSESLEMGGVHTCETTHCVAGWACHALPGGKVLEERHGWWLAGATLLGLEAASHFYDSNEAATAWLKRFLPAGLGE